MQWTSDAPTEAGWYGWRDTNDDSGLVLFDGVWCHDVFDAVGNMPRSDGRYIVEFFGPLTPHK